MGLFCCITSYGNQIEVCSTCKVTTIKDAIDKAEDGDEIIIHSGVYKEHGLEITKSLHITGIDLPVIDGELKETIFSISANNFSIKGLKIINVGKSYTKDFAAILVSKSENFVIHHKVVYCINNT